MSYDLFLWTKKRPEITEHEIDIEDCLLTIEDPYAVDAEDIPSHVLLCHEGISYMTAMYLQPYPKNEKIIKHALKVASGYAAAYVGVVDNPQTEQVKTKLRKNQAGKQSADAPSVSLTLCFSCDTNLHSTLPLFLDLLEKHFPAALPKRYGAYEPLPYQYAERNKDHFVQYLSKNDSFVFWKGTSPVTYIFLRNGSKLNMPAAGAACSSITIQIFKEAYQKSNYQVAVHLLMKKSAVLFNVFFAQVIDSKSYTINGPRWRGIPAKTGYAFVIGEPYYSLLKPEQSQGEQIGQNLMCFTANNRPRIPGKYLSRRKLFWPPKTVSHEMKTLARDIPIL